MVVALKPGRFYGKSLPRPHIYNDIKFNSERVDPPRSINDALMRWASDAHWSMGGLSFKRKRMQGKIEGRIGKIRAEEEQDDASPQKVQQKSPTKPKKAMAFEVQTNAYSKSMSPIDVLLLADEKARESAKDVSPRRKSVDRMLHRSSPLAKLSKSEGKLSKSEGKASAAAKKPVKRAVKRALLVEDSDSDDGLEEFLNDTGRPLRRSGRLQTVTTSPGKLENAEVTRDEDIVSDKDLTESRSVQRKELPKKEIVTANEAQSLRRSSRMTKSPIKS
ncbi:hypothetical protein O6H91_Y328200 [Diphasiastrum complanatum]|nr:hypothetical protein O6H91_Y328200 [Diphasiastrum complanatum]